MAIIKEDQEHKKKLGNILTLEVLAQQKKIMKDIFQFYIKNLEDIVWKINYIEDLEMIINDRNKRKQ
jgi:hypothetical protein